MQDQKKQLVESLIVNFKKIRLFEARLFNHPQHNKQQIPYHHLMILQQLTEEGPIPLSKIKNDYNISASAATQFVNKLEKNGYITRATNPDDHRSYLIQLSKKGKTAVDNSTIETHKFMEELLAYIGKEDTMKLKEIVDKIVEFYYLQQENK